MMQSNVEPEAKMLTPNGLDNRLDKKNSYQYVRKIIHVDMDCFYAAVEMRENPSLYGKPVAVGGQPDQRGVLATCNYEARKFGLHSAMASALAVKKCPNLILIPCNMTLYRDVSLQIRAIFERYTDKIEPLSLDEAYLDVTDNDHCHGSATWIAEEIRMSIKNELKLTASVGIAPLKFLAKIASEQNKPDGQFVIRPEDVEAFLLPLALNKIPGVGKVTTDKLSQMNLLTCADIREFSQKVLLDRFGKLGMRIWVFSHGTDTREVNTHSERKSVGVENTLREDINKLEQVYPIVDILFEKLIERLQHNKPNIALTHYRKIGVKLKFSDFQTTTLESSYGQVTTDDFYQLMKNIWVRSEGRSVRLVGLHVNLPKKEETQQLNLW